MSAKSKVPQPMSPTPTQLLHLQLNPESISKSTPQKSQSTNPLSPSTFPPSCLRPETPPFLPQGHFSVCHEGTSCQRRVERLRCRSPGVRSCWEMGRAKPAVGRLGATALRTFLPCHFLSIMIEVGNAERGRCCCLHGNGHKRMSKH